MRDTDKRPTTNTLNTRSRWQYCRQEQTEMMPSIWQGVWQCSKLNHFKDVCRGARGSVVNTTERETVHEQEPCIGMVNINSFSFNSNHSAIMAILKTPSNKATIVVPYKVDMGSDRNIMPFNIFTKLFPRTTADKLAATKDVTNLWTYNCATITQLGRCKVQIENNEKKPKNTFSL